MKENNPPRRKVIVDLDFSLPNGFEKIVQAINEEKFAHGDTDFSVRMLHYYAAQNLLHNPSEVSGKRWFSCVQLFWLSILKELISRGFSVDEIKSLKERFDRYEYVSKLLDSYSLLEIHFAMAVYFKNDFRLLIDNEMDYAIYDFSTENIISWQDILFDNTHLHIPLFNKIKTIWEKHAGYDESMVAFKPKNLYSLTEAEKQFLPHIRKMGTTGFKLNWVESRSERKDLLVGEYCKDINPKTIKSVCELLGKQKYSEVFIQYHNRVGKPERILIKQNKRYKQ